jgi:hypothetical protein
MLLVGMAALAVGHLSEPVSAEIKGCYKRVYDTNHLQKHPHQKITTLQVQYGFYHGEDNTEEDDYNYVMARVRDNPALFYGSMGCTGESGKLTCTNGQGAGAWAVEPKDDGRFTLTETKEGLTLLLETDLRIYEEGTTTAYDVTADDENRKYVLKKVYSKSCPYLK